MQNPSLELFSQLLIIVLTSPESPPFSEQSLMVAASFPPLKDESRLLSSLVGWCFPEGISVSNKKRELRSFEFIMTDEKCQWSYCSGLVVYERHFVRGRPRIDHSQFLLKASLEELVDNPLAAYGNIEQIYIPKVLLAISPLPVFPVQQQLLSFISQAGPDTPLDLVLSVVSSIECRPSDRQLNYTW